MTQISQKNALHVEDLTGTNVSRNQVVAGTARPVIHLAFEIEI